MKYGGTAGGSSKKDNIQVSRPVPKFLQAFKYQQPEEDEAKLEDKFQTDKPDDEVEDYDVENAQLVNENGELIEKEGGKKAKNNLKNYDGSYVREEDNTKVDIHTFRPTFKSKKIDSHTDTNIESKAKKTEEEDRQRSKEKEREKEKERNQERDQDRDRDRNKDKDREGDRDRRDRKEDRNKNDKGNKDSNEAENKKAKIDKYISQYLKEVKDKKDDKTFKKVKGNLLSFNDEF